MAGEESYPLKIHLQANAIYAGIGAVLGVIIWGLAFDQEDWWHGAVGGAIIAPATMYLAPIVTGILFNDDNPEV